MPTIQLNLPNPKWLKALLVLILLIVIWLCLDKCTGPSNVGPEPEPLKTDIKQETKSRDSVKKEVKKVDSVRIEYVIKWRNLKHDTIKLPCDSVLHKIVHICDTLILVDSTEISDLKKVVKLDSLIISNQFKELKNDSLQITGLKKEVKKQRFFKRVFQLTTGAALILGVVR